MAGVIVFAVALAAIKTRDAVQDRRSPLLPTPFTTDPALTERDIKKTLLAWQAREQVLSAKVRGLDLAHESGYAACWAEQVAKRREVRQARNAARWVCQKLHEVLVWCRAQGLKKGSIISVGKKAAAQRPRHSTTPPALFELPFPLPIPPKNDVYALTVERKVAEAPPLYQEELTGGEKLLEASEEPYAYEA